MLTAGVRGLADRAAAAEYDQHVRYKPVGSILKLPLTVSPLPTVDFSDRTAPGKLVATARDVREPPQAYFWRPKSSMNVPNSSIDRAPEPQGPRGSCLGVLMIATLISVVVAALNFVTMGLFGLVAIVIGIILMISMFHYLVWGWWLGGMIRREAEEEPSDEEGWRD